MRGRVIILCLVVATMLSSYNVVTLNSYKEKDILKKYESNQSAVENTTQIDKKEVYSFNKLLKGDKISFELYSENKGSLNDLCIEIKGVKSKPLKITFEIDGVISDAEIGNIDNDGLEELLVYSRSAGSGGYGYILALSVNSNNKIVQINFPEDLNDKIKEGYMGHDLFRLKGKSLVRKFPIYTDGDSNAYPTGGNRKVIYNLEVKNDSKMFVYSRHTDGK